MQSASAVSCPRTGRHLIVCDLGYYDFSWWALLDGAGCRLVTRFKANTPLREAKDMPLAGGIRHSER